MFSGVPCLAKSGLDFTNLKIKIALTFGKIPHHNKHQIHHILLCRRMLACLNHIQPYTPDY